MSRSQPNSPRHGVARLLGVHFWGLIEVLEILTFCASAYVLVKTAVDGVPQLDHELGPSGSLAATIGVPVAGFALLVAAARGAESAGGHRLVRGIGVLALLATLPLALSLHPGSKPPVTARSPPPHVRKKPPNRKKPPKKPEHYNPRAPSSKQPSLVAKGTTEHTRTALADLTAKAAGCGCEKFSPYPPKPEGDKTKTTEAPITEKPSHETATPATTTTTDSTPTPTPPATPPAATTPATTPSSPASGSNIDTGDTGKNDSGNDDSGNNDSGSNDLGSNDAGNDDTGNNDVGNYDSGENDAGEHDSGNNDAGNYETGNNEA